MTVEPALHVVEPGPLLLIEDLGRPGWAHLGVPTSGAADPASLRLANRLVGNDEAAAGLELTRGPVTLRAQRSTRLALTGAPFEIVVNSRPAAWGTPISVPPGHVVEVRPTGTGLRCWLGVAGGIEVPRVFGSCATDRLTGLGPRPLSAGDVLYSRAVWSDPVAASAVPPPIPATTLLHIDLGPRVDWFDPAAARHLVEIGYVVSPDSDRVGVRLEATTGTLLERRVTSELPSEGIVTGAVQVPPSGQPLIFGVDHPVTGGFPVIAVVRTEDLASCAQLRPGDQVRFTTARTDTAR